MNLISICILLLFVLLIVGYLILKREVSSKTRNLEIEIESRKQAEASLREAEANYRLMVESQKDLIVKLDPHQRIIYANPSYCKTFGKTEKDFPGKGNPFLEPSAIAAVLESMTDNQRMTDFEQQLETVNGRHWFEWSFQPVLDGKLEIKEIVAVGRDITARKKIEESLHEKKAFLDNISDIAYIADMEGNLTYVNPASERVTGLASDLMVGQPFVPLFVEKDHQSLIDVYARTIAGESLENMLMFTSGVTCHFTSLPLRNSSGEIIGTFGIGRDVTEILNTQKALQESEARLKKAQTVAKIGNWEYDIATGEVWGSEQAFKIYGIERTSPKLPLDRVEACTPNAPKVNKSLIDLIHKNKKYDIEFEVHKEDGGEKIFIHSVAELILENGIPKKVLGVIQDITEQKKAVREKELLRKRLRHSQKMESVGMLAGGIAHDFNNILFPLLGYTEMMLEDIAEDDPSRIFLDEVLNGILRARDLVKQILSFSRQDEKERIPFKIHMIIKEVLRLSRSTLPSTIAIEQDIQDVSAMVMGDATQIYQVVMNLITNAFQAMEKAGGTLTVQLKTIEITPETLPSPELSPGPYVCLTVKDTGAGIDAANAERIFNPYFTTKEKDKGTGLGLAIVYGIIQSHKGVIKVQSEPGKGASFTVYLPRISHTVDSQIEKKSVDVISGDERILLVDNETSILEMIDKMLTRLGYGITSLTSSMEALEAFRSDPDKFQLVIVDLTMPGLTGNKLIIELKKIRQDIPVILCTGYASKLTHEAISSIGIDRVLLKPIIREELASAVRGVLDNQKKLIHIPIPNTMLQYAEKG